MDPFTNVDPTGNPEHVGRSPQLSKTPLNRVIDAGQEATVLETRESLDLERAMRGWIANDRYFISRIREAAAGAVSLSEGEAVSANEVLISEPPANVDADISLRVPHLTGDIRKYISESVPVIIRALEQRPECEEVKAIGPYINIKLRQGTVAGGILREVESLGTRYGETDSFANRRALVDYSSPNIGKALHVGHLGTTLVGQALANILEAVGYTAIRVNHLGDWGTPLGKLRVAWEELKDTEEIRALEGQPAKYFSTLYARFSQLSAARPELDEAARKFFADLERGEPEMRRFWKFVRDESVKELNALYDQFNVHFHAYIGESFYEGYLPAVLDRALASGAVTKTGVAVVGGDSESGMGKFLLVKSDGATTYLTRDLAALDVRTSHFEPDITLYVVGSEQKPHFKQLFFLANAASIGGNSASEYRHIPIGLITSNGAKISSREGGTLALEELLSQVVSQAETCLGDTCPPELKPECAHAIALGALYYEQLKKPTGTGLKFDLDKMLSMKGASGPYLQYTAVRCASLLHKEGQVQQIPDDESLATLDPSAFAVLLNAAMMPNALEYSARSCSPHILVEYLDNFAKSVNKLLAEVRIKDQVGSTRDGYLKVIEAAHTVLSNGLRDLGIPIPKRM